MIYTEQYIQRILLTTTSGSPFSLKRDYNLLTIFNLSWGFFKYGEADIVTIRDDYSLIEGEIKCTYRDFLNDDKKNPEIWEERKKKLWGKYYIIPKDIYNKYSDEIFNICCKRKCGLITINGTQTIIVWNAPELSDYTIDLNKFNKLVKLTCYRQCESKELLEFKELDDNVKLST